MRRRIVCSVIAVFALLLLGPFGKPASAQLALTPDAPVSAPLPEPAVGVTIEWRVRNRFRLFREERDWNSSPRHVLGHTRLPDSSRV